MSIVFLGGILLLVFLFGGTVLAALAIWALLAKKESLPQWAKIVLWLFVVLAVVVLIAAVVGIFLFFGRF